MRTHLLRIAALLLLTAPVNAQFHAGEVPPGMNAMDVNIHIVLPIPNTTSSATFEVDCDDQPEVMVTLVHGQPAVDAPNIAILQMLDDDLELCMDLAPYYRRPQYYNFGQELYCTDNFDWQSDSVNVLGDFGSWMAIGPTDIDSMYVAYRRGVQIGWILLSFDVNDGLSVSLRIHQVLPICPASTSIEQHGPSPALVLFPNPGSGGPVRVESPDALRGIEVLDPAGRPIARYGGMVRTIASPEVAGTYLVRAIHADGRRSFTRLIRH